MENINKILNKIFFCFWQARHLINKPEKTENETIEMEKLLNGESEEKKENVQRDSPAAKYPVGGEWISYI